MALPVEPGPHATPANTQRPTGVTILAVLAIVAGVLAVFAGFAFLAVGAFVGATGAAADSAGLGIMGALGALAGVAFLLYAAFAFVVAYGLFNRKRWAWYASLVLAALQLLQGLGSLVSFELFSAILGLAIGGFIAWYLLSPPVQAWFAVSHSTPWKYKQGAT